MARAKSSILAWFTQCCGCCEVDDHGNTQLLAHTTPVNAPEAGFSEVHVSEEEGGLEIQEQKVAPEQGEEEVETAPVEEEKVVMRSGSYVRQGGSRLSWKMVPSEEAAVSDLIASQLKEEEEEVEEVEVVLKELPEVEGELYYETENKQVAETFQTTVTVSSPIHQAEDTAVALAHDKSLAEQEDITDERNSQAE